MAKQHCPEDPLQSFSVPLGVRVPALEQRWTNPYSPHTARYSAPRSWLEGGGRIEMRDLGVMWTYTSNWCPETPCCVSRSGSFSWILFNLYYSDRCSHSIPTMMRL